MENESLKIWAMSKQDFFPQDMWEPLRGKLDKMPADNADAVARTINLKNPSTTLLMSIFLGAFGIDRFILGDVGIGLLKLIASSVSWVLGFVFAPFPFGVGLILHLAPLVGWVVDIFLCRKKTREVNYATIMKMIDAYSE